MGVGKEFANWIKDRINKYEFIEDEDYKLTIAKTGKRKNVIQKNYSLTLDMAKELSMVENNKIYLYQGYIENRSVPRVGSGFSIVDNILKPYRCLKQNKEII